MDPQIDALIESFKSKPFYLSETERKEILKTLSSMNTREKVGQLFCVLASTYSDEELKELVFDYGIGGVLFRPDKTDLLLQRVERIQGGRIPLLVAANLEEGGIGAIRDGTYFSSQMGVSASGDLRQCEHFAKVCANEGKRIGVNWTFSPVCDIDYNYLNPITNVRTFGSNPDQVKSFAREYVRVIQESQMAACAKHFPGDGVDYRDQHLHPTINSLSAEKWENTYGFIYRSLIDEGLLSIMVGHIKQPDMEMKLDPSLTYEKCMPASLSKPLLTTLLRQRYGFNGLITSDATIMGGFTMAMERRKAIPTAINSGCDMLVFSTDIKEDYQFMLEAVENGFLSLNRLDEAVCRILALKKKVCRKMEVSEALPAKEWAKQCASKAITLVKDRTHQIPISVEKTPRIRLIVLGTDEIEGQSLSLKAKEILERYGFQVEIYRREEDEMHGVGNLSKQRLTLYIANEKTESNRTTVRLSWNPKHALDVPRHIHEEPSIFLSLYNPYHLQDVPNIPTYINAYTPTLSVLESALSKLVGEEEFTGTSPIDAFCGLMDTRY